MRILTLSLKVHLLCGTLRERAVIKIRWCIRRRQRLCRALYGAKVGNDGRFYKAVRADWECRQCAELRYSSEGGALVLRGGPISSSSAAITPIVAPRAPSRGFLTCLHPSMIPGLMIL